MRRPRLMYVVNNIDYFYSHRHALAHAAQTAGFDIHVVAPHTQSGRYPHDASLTFHQVTMSRRGVFHPREWRAAAALRNLFRRVRPDVVHNIATKQILMGSLAASLAKVPAVVNTVAGLGFVYVDRSPRARVLRQIADTGYRIAAKHPNCHFIFQNPDDQAALLPLLGRSTAHARVIRGSGVVPGEYPVHDPPVDSKRVVLASRLLRHKGIADFVAAARIVRRSHPDVQFILAGQPDDGNPASHSTEEVRAWVHEGAITWMGWVRDMDALFSESLVACLPSYYGEGVPKVLIEAAACGRAIVTADTPGCREIVQHEVNGLLVPPRDPERLATAISSLVERPETCRRMGRAGRERVESIFAMDIVNEETLQVYRKALAPEKRATMDPPITQPLVPEAKH